MHFELRPFTAADAAALLEIYTPIVLTTAISFEWEPPTLESFRTRLETLAARYPCLVACSAGQPLGYAYANRFRERRSYDWTAETSVYVHEHARGQGVAQALMRRVLADCRAQGLRLAIAGITLPNPASQGLHRSLGFSPVGRFVGAGYKFARAWDLEFWQLPLAPAEDSQRSGSEAP